MGLIGEDWRGMIRFLSIPFFLMGVASIVCGIQGMLAFSSAKTGTCCVPEGCSNPSAVLHQPVSYLPYKGNVWAGVCDLTPDQAQDMGCPYAANNVLANCTGLKYSEVCQKNQNNALNLGVGICAIIQGTFMAIGWSILHYASVKGDTISRDNVFWVEFPPMFLLCLSFSCNLVVIILGSIVVHRLTRTPFALPSAEICSAHAGDSCIAYDHAEFQGCSDPSANKNADALSWVLGADDAIKPIIALLVFAVLHLLTAISLLIHLCTNCCDKFAAMFPKPRGERMLDGRNDVLN